MKKELNYSIKSGYDEMNFEKVTDMLKDAYWCKGISQQEVVQGAQNSAFQVGAFNEEGEQIGYARVISDKTRFAYILDVIVDAGYRRKGIGHSMIIFILNHPDMKDVYQWLLITKDAQEVYRKLGFKSVDRRKSWMEIRLGRPKR